MSSARDTIRDALLEHLPDLLNNEKILEECINTCVNYEKSGDDFYYERESLKFGSKMKNASAIADEVTMDDVAQIRSKFQRNLAKANIKKQPVTGGLFKGKVAVQAKPSTSGLSLTAKRPLVQARGQPSGSTKGFTVDFKGPTGTERNRYMYETVGERGSVLDEHIEEIGDLLKQHYDIVDFGDPNSITEDDITVVGRICGEADASAVSSSSKLVEDTIFLESSRSMGSGSYRVALRFESNLKLRGIPQGSGSLSIFPGAIVALKGKNGGGTCFVVNEILAVNTQQPISHKSFSMTVACGPFTNDSDLEFKPFSSLMEKLSSLRPSVVLLQGPFVDANHPSIRKGDIDEPPSQIFAERVTKPLLSFLHASPNSLILLVPSISDILSNHPVLPQSELEIAALSDYRIKFLANPCRFSINDVTFAATSVDVLFHLRNQELMLRGQEVDPSPSTKGTSHDPITNACRHLLQQRSFYPLFPVPADFSSEVNLDVSHSEGLRLLTDSGPHAPDVLLLSSKLKHFSKVIESTIAINPSFAVKGTHATITVSDTQHSTLRDHMQCEILKL
ncbi:DNA polymerase alpha, subunit B [Schizopora paradoxa]|uniref:DNA polymerase alpha subunit B n=1 Tax=Schizopora paradoxa TaxID=27342 RepID=A0A0H2RYT2_9AGAM|nr:DNA polymerase alpha, subunit B [Schizopora paradoxa]